jgi:hypothetical protein
LALILAVLWLNGALSLRDEVATEARRHGQLAGQIARIRQYATQTEWPDRAKQVRATQLELEGRLWRAGTLGLAQAAFQDWLAQGVRETGLERPELTLLQEGGLMAVDGDVNPWKIKAKLAFDFSPVTFMAWLARVAGHERRIIVEQLVVRQEPVPRVEMVLVAPFRKNQ